MTKFNEINIRKYIQSKSVCASGREMAGEGRKIQHWVMRRGESRSKFALDLKIWALQGFLSLSLSCVIGSLTDMVLIHLDCIGWMSSILTGSMTYCPRALSVMEFWVRKNHCRSWQWIKHICALERHGVMVILTPASLRSKEDLALGLCPHSGKWKGNVPQPLLPDLY